MRALALVGIVFVALCIALVLSMQRLQAQARAAKADDEALEWERLRKRIAEMLEDCHGSTIVLITGYRVYSESAGHALRQSFEVRWSDRVEVTWKAESPQPHWAVVTTSETVVVTPVLERQWLGRMRTVCKAYDCQVSSCGVLWGGAPPSEASVVSEPV
jgi:hypothetical protein